MKHIILKTLLLNFKVIWFPIILFIIINFPKYWLNSVCQIFYKAQVQNPLWNALLWKKKLFIPVIMCWSVILAYGLVHAFQIWVSFYCFEYLLFPLLHFQYICYYFPFHFYKIILFETRKDTWYHQVQCAYFWNEYTQLQSLREGIYRILWI